jgi:hypothetical protein
MNARKYGLASVLAAGVVVLILTSLGLFWARCLCGTWRHEVLSAASGPVTIRPSYLIPGEVRGDPNSASLSAVDTRVPNIDPLLAGLGMARYLEARLPGGCRSPVYEWSTGPDEVRVYLDTGTGQIVCRGRESFPQAGRVASFRDVTLYVGPEGMGERPDEKFGRFVSPIVDVQTSLPWVIYDRGLRRFFAVRLRQRTVTKGPELPEGDAHRPVQVGGLLAKNPLVLQSALWLPTPPSRTSTDESPDTAVAPRPAAAAVGYFPSLGGSALVLDASGRIELLDMDTLTFVREVARLPRPAGLFSRGTAAAPDDVAAYAVRPATVRRGDGRGAWRYAGCAVAVLSSDATAGRVEVFDPNGRVLASDETKFAHYTQPGAPDSASTNAVESAYFGVPGTAALTGLKFALENLHPPVLLLLSYFTAPHFEATAGYRSLLLLPGSFVAMKARDTNAGPVNRFVAAEILMLPSVVLAVLLASLVARDGARMGLPKNTRTLWVVGVVVFGLPAYVTYRLTRPTIRMVTCQNCGRMRRPDQAKCHACGSVWVVPELVPPAWRVLDNESEAEGRVLAPAEQPGSSAP